MSSEETFTFLVKARTHTVLPGDCGNLVTINLTPIIGNFHVQGIRIREVHVPLIMYNITDNNNIIELNIPSGSPYPPPTYSITLAPGSYSAAGLCSAIIDAFTTAFIATTYSFVATFSDVDFLTTLQLVDSALPPPGFVSYDLRCNWVVPDETPPLFQLLGFGTGTVLIASATGSETSPAPMNSTIDRLGLITCRECVGMVTAYGSAEAPTWHDGLVSHFPLTGNVGDVVDYMPGHDAPWIKISKEPNGPITVLNLELHRDAYQFFGPTEIDMTLIIELR